MTEDMEIEAIEEAANILENILFRKNYTIDTRDAVASALLEFRNMAKQPRIRGRQAKAEAEIKKVLGKGPNIAANIQTATGIPLSSIRPSIRRMMDKGELEVIGKFDRAKVFKLVKK